MPDIGWPLNAPRPGTAGPVNIVAVRANPTETSADGMTILDT